MSVFGSCKLTGPDETINGVTEKACADMGGRWTPDARIGDGALEPALREPTDAKLTRVLGELVALSGIVAKLDKRLAKIERRTSAQAKPSAAAPQRAAGPAAGRAFTVVPKRCAPLRCGVLG